MKRLVLCFLLLIFAVTLTLDGNFLHTKKTFAQSEQSSYGLIVESKTILYRTPVNSDESDNIYFYLPETYFVELLEKVDEVFYKVKYVDLVGYVKFSAINVKDYIPVSKFPTNLSLKVSGDITANIRLMPNTGSELVTTLPSGASAEYYNKIEGQQLNSGSSYWYYIKVTNGSQSLWGYIYADYITVTSEILIPNDISAQPSNDKKDPDEKLNDKYTFWTQVLIAVAICIPVVFIIYLIFKPRKREV